MTKTVTFRVDYADYASLLKHLTECDESFVPTLSDRVNIPSYVNKVFENSKRFEAWQDGELIGLVAAYCNDLNKRISYITSVSILPSRRGQGIAVQLVENCIDHVRLLGFDAVQLEVDQQNQQAVSLYRKCGFEVTHQSDQSFHMTMSFRNSAK